MAGNNLPSRLKLKILSVQPFEGADRVPGTSRLPPRLLGLPWRHRSLPRLRTEIEVLDDLVKEFVGTFRALLPAPLDTGLYHRPAGLRTARHALRQRILQYSGLRLTAFAAHNNTK